MSSTNCCGTACGQSEPKNSRIGSHCFQFPILNCVSGNKGTECKDKRRVGHMGKEQAVAQEPCQHCKHSQPLHSAFEFTVE
jgi:hypothetical protein